MLREMCEKCKELCNRESMQLINTKAERCFLCETCYIKWEKIYNKWKRNNCNNFWGKGWKEFIYGRVNRKFNPSLRDKYENCVRK